MYLLLISASKPASAGMGQNLGAGLAPGAAAQAATRQVAQSSRLDGELSDITAQW